MDSGGYISFLIIIVYKDLAFLAVPILGLVELVPPSHQWLASLPSSFRVANMPFLLRVKRK
jgi:hypothetical protein